MQRFEESKGEYVCHTCASRHLTHTGLDTAIECGKTFPINMSTHMMSTTFDMYIKTDSIKDHVQEVHTAKTLGKILLHCCTIKHKQSTKSIECQNHSQSSHALKPREVIKITPNKNPHME